MLFENEKKTANGQQEGRCANAREGGRSIACCWFCIFKQDQPSQFKQTRAPISIKKSSRLWKFPLKHFVLPRLPCPHFWNWKWFPVVFLLPSCCVFCLSFSTTGVVLLLAGGAVLVGVTSSAATHALAKGGSDLWCNCYTPATRRYIDTNVNVHFYLYYHKYNTTFCKRGPKIKAHLRRSRKWPKLFWKQSHRSFEMCIVAERCTHGWSLNASSGGGNVPLHRVGSVAADWKQESHLSISHLAAAQLNGNHCSVVVHNLWMLFSSNLLCWWIYQQLLGSTYTSIMYLFLVC